uniref:Carn_acyltransf domain-containing protein n=1 Tax=Heterorhabditis bacteriophora TaxID=37862 RepID=A0A1I7WCL5_HETBA
MDVKLYNFMIKTAFDTKICPCIHKDILHDLFSKIDYITKSIRFRSVVFMINKFKYEISSCIYAYFFFILKDVINLLDYCSRLVKNYRSKIIQHSKMNEQNIKIVEESCFCVVLAHNTYGSESELLQASLMGDSTHQWADKCVNIVFLTDGQVLLQGDHSNVDAIVVMHAGDDSAMKSRRTLWQPDEDVLFDIPVRLSFDLTTEDITGIIDAKRKFNVAKEMHRVDSIKFTGYGNDLLRKAHLYSDTIVQIALQLAFLKTHGSFAPIYETASTRKFFHGRTETVRSCTQEIVNFGRAVIDKRDLNTQRDLLKVAYNEHNNLMNDCMDGRARTKNKRIGDKEWAFSFIGYMLDDEIGGHGYVSAMRPDGYGTFYRIGKNIIQLTITDWRDTKSNLDVYGENICWALDHIGCLISTSSSL